METLHALTGRLTVFLTGSGKDSGNTTGSRAIADFLGVECCSTPQVIARDLETERGLPRGIIDRARALDRDAYRCDLGLHGDRMVAEGRQPGPVAVQDGHVVIEGIRRLDELTTAIDEAARFGKTPIVLHIVRPGTEATADKADAVALGDYSGKQRNVPNDSSRSLLRYRLITTFLSGVERSLGPESSAERIHERRGQVILGDMREPSTRTSSLLPRLVAPRKMPTDPWHSAREGTTCVRHVAGPRQTVTGPRVARWGMADA